MTTTTLPRAATSPELVLIRADNQSHDWRLTIPVPATIYTARLAAVPTSTDKVASITYASGAGVGGKTYADILPDQALLIGSSAGGYDLGICRIRKLTGIGATSGVFAIAETSEVDWSTVVSGGIYLTVVDDFDLCPRHIKMAANGTTPLMDYDLDLSAGADNENIATGHLPVPIMGQNRVLWLRGTTVSVTIYDLISSWVIDGTITSYATVCAGASASSGMNTATPTMTFNAVGDYRWQTTVTASNGKTYTSYRFIYIRTEATCTTQFELSGLPSGNNDQGGYSFTVTLYDEATRALVRDRALVILHPKSYYGNTQVEVGFNTGSENVYIGRIAKETIRHGTDDAYGSVTFEVQGPQFWFGQMTAFAEGCIDVASESLVNKWTKFSNLNVDKALYHFAMWRTTATRCMDVYPSGDTRRIKRLEAPAEFIWQQWIEIFNNSIRAKPCCDRVGRLFLEIDQQLMLSRAAVPTVMAITADDWHESIDLDREVVPQAGRVDLSGTSWSGTAVAAQFALSPGHVFKKHGSVVAQDRLALDGVQANTNTLAGLNAAVKNNPYPKIAIKLASLHGLLDIAPHMRATLAITAADTPRGIAETLTLIPRSISVVAGNNSGVYYQEIEFEAEVTAALAITGDTPVTAPTPPVEPFHPPVVIVIPPVNPTPSGTGSEFWTATTGATSDDNRVYFTGDLISTFDNQPTWNQLAAPGTIVHDILPVFDGSAVYVESDRAGADTIYKLSNVAAIRAVPTTTPTWTKVLAIGDVITGGPIQSFLDSWLYKNTLCIIARSSTGYGYYYYAEYTGSTLSGWAYVPIDAYPYFTGHGVSVFRGFGAGYYYAEIRNMANQVVGTTWQLTAGDQPNRSFHQNDLDTNRVIVSNFGGIYNTTLGLKRDPTADVLGRMTGALRGLQLYTTTAIGEFMSAADGHTWTKPSSPSYDWAQGIIKDAKLTGGGTLAWLRSVVTANNELLRVSGDNGVTWPVAKTGNFWDIATPGNKTFVNCGLVYK